MKKVLLILLGCSLLICIPKKSDAFVWVIVKAAIKKAIKAADLAIQRQQNKVIWLQNAQKALENEMAKLKLDQITDWSQKQKDLFQKYYTELQNVKQVIATYEGVKHVMERESALVRAYQQTWNLLRNDPHFTPDELTQMAAKYTALLDESAGILDEVMRVVNPLQTQMSDGARLEMINRASGHIDKIYADVVRSNHEYATLSIGRASSDADVQELKALYGNN
jgi:hypothetical protein